MLVYALVRVRPCQPLTTCTWGMPLRHTACRLPCVQHMEFYARLKQSGSGASEATIDESVRLALQSVNLWSVREKASGTFSGGATRARPCLGCRLP